MRSDMHKVVIERPRWNPGPSKRGRRDNLPDELLPKFEGIKRPHVHRKGLTDLLGPLKRWLQSQVGRPWNDVYSEACAVIKPDSIIRAHVKTHLLQFVERSTFMHGGKVCILDTGYLGRGVIPVTERRYYKSSCFFVHPESGLLYAIPQQPRPRRFDPNAERRAQMSCWVNETSVLRQLNGCWFACCVSPFPRRFAKGDSPWRFDVAEKKLICRSTAHEVYAQPVYCTTKRQLSRRELRRYGLRNDSIPRVQPSIGYFCCRLKAALCIPAV
jgi:hypothetical protein